MRNVRLVGIFLALCFSLLVCGIAFGGESSPNLVIQAADGVPAGPQPQFIMSEIR